MYVLKRENKYGISFFQGFMPVLIPCPVWTTKIEQAKRFKTKKDITKYYIPKPYVIVKIK